MEGVLKAMLVTKLKTSMLVLGAGVFLLAVTGSAYQALKAERTDGNTLVQRPAPAKRDQPGQPADGSEAAMKDRESLQGSWRLVACTHDGKEVPAELVKQVQIDFQGNRMRFSPPLDISERQIEGDKEKHVEFQIGEGEFEVVFRLEPARKPKGIELTMSDTVQGQVVKGIYALEGARLKICLGEKDRPTDFTCKAESRRGLYVMEKKPVAKPSGKQARQTDEQTIQGTWKVVAAERYGLTWKNVDGEFVMQDKVALAFPISPELPHQVIFAGETCNAEFSQGAGRTLVLKDTFTLDARRKPKWITLMAEDGDITYGIYALDRDELRLCWQFGQRRNWRPSDFQTKNDINQEDDTEVWVLKRSGPDSDKEAAPKGEAKPVAIQRSWEGILNNRNLLKESPPEGFVVDAKSWEIMWKSWRGKERMPEIDFEKQIALVLTVPGANKISAPELRVDRAGNLKVPLPVSTLLPDDGRIGYKIVLINRQGIQSVNGRPVAKVPNGTAY
jgi:uncharacterized protein (TIGR03067 family)